MVKNVVAEKIRAISAGRKLKISDTTTAQRDKNATCIVQPKKLHHPTDIEPENLAATSIMMTILKMRLGGENEFYLGNQHYILCNKSIYQES
jgi:hypothetical protein